MPGGRCWVRSRGGSAEVGRDVSGRQLRCGEKGGSAVGKPKRGKGTKWMVLVDGGGLPLGVRLESASPGDVTLAQATLAQVKVPRQKGRPRQKPKRVIADRAYDSDPLRERLARRGIDLIVPYRKKQQAPALPGRQETQTLQTTLDHRTHQRLARSVPKTPCAP